MTPESTASTGEAPPRSSDDRFRVPPECLPDLDSFAFGDLAPVENIFIEKQQRLLTEPLYSGWAGPQSGKSFQAFAGVGFFYGNTTRGQTPNVMVATDTHASTDLSESSNNAYFGWLRWKPPDLIVEIVSDRRAREADFNMATYQRYGVTYYIIFDPQGRLGFGVLRAFGLYDIFNRPLSELWFPHLSLGLTLWQGTYEKHERCWLRWRDQEGALIPTGAERANEEARKRQLLEARLRALGIDPDSPGEGGPP